MRIYYDTTRKNVVVGETNRLFATGSLVASQDRGRVSVRYVSTNFPEVFVKFTDVQKQDGSPAGTTITEVINYLNNEFNQSPFSGGSGSIPEYTSDPVTPTASDAWVLRTLLNPANTLQAFVGGVPMSTQTPTYKYQFSYRTSENTTVRTLLS